MSDDEVESILLHVTRLAPVGGLQDLHYVLHRYISLQVGLAKHLMTLQGLKGVRLYAELSTDIHNFCTESGNGCLSMLLKGFFANINMKPENKVTGSQGVVELFME